MVIKVINQFYPHVDRLQTVFLGLLLSLKQDECHQEGNSSVQTGYDESLSQYWSRFKGLLDSCPNNRMYEVEVYNILYEGANPESNDLLNSSSCGNFTNKRVSEAREILGRLIDAKKTYDSPRTILRRGNVDAVYVQNEDRMDARMDKLEKTILTALEKNNPPAPAENAKQMPGPEEGYHCYGQPGEGDFQAQVNSVGSWNPDGS